MGFFTGGAKSLSFGNMGDMTWQNRLRGGAITDISDEKVQTDWKTNIPNPQGKTQVIVTAQCIGGGPLLRAAYASDPVVKAVIDKYGAPVDERTDPSDDGRRGIYVKGNMRFDIGNKLRELQIEEPLIGGELYLVFTTVRQTPSGPGRSYEVLYFPPVAGPAAGGFYDPTAQQAAPAAPQQSAPPAFGGGAPAPQSPAQPPAAPPAPADPWGAGSAAQQPAQPPQQGSPAASPWG